MNRILKHGILLLIFWATGLPGLAQAQQDMSDVEIQVHPVAEGVYMLTGRGGNIGLSVGEDGAFIIDDQFAPLTEKIQAAIASVSDQPVRFVVNTHLHGDHTGGNENFGKAGAIIVAHENVRERMEAALADSEDLSEDALPVITFSEAATFHWNGDALHISHVDPAHTDGDVIIHFQGANVLHMGDLFFNGFYPYIDVNSGGALPGVIAAAERALALADEETKIIPGHGPLSKKTELQVYHDMLVTIHGRMQELIAAGNTRDEIIAAKPTADFDEEWGGGFMQPDNWVGILYDSLQR